MTPQQIALLVLGILLVIFIVILIVVSAKLRAVRKREESEEQRADKVKIVKGVRYSTDDVIEDADGMNVTHLPGDFLLSRGEVYRAERGGKLLPGVYTALSAEGGGEFKIRISGLVKNFSHGDKIVIGDGDEISAVSASVILR